MLQAKKSMCLFDPDVSGVIPPKQITTYFRATDVSTVGGLVPMAGWDTHPIGCLYTIGLAATTPAPEQTPLCPARRSSCILLCLHLFVL